MMKVKPFSYHIPPRRKTYDNSSPAKKSFITSYFPPCSSSNSSSGSNNNTRNRKDSNRTSTAISHHPTFVTSSGLFSFGGVGTVLTLVLLGFIGVAGQGKLTEMQDNSDSTFPTQGLLPEKQSLSYKGIHSLSNIGVLGEEEDNNNDDDDDVLQRRISSMGHYGNKYRNSSFPYNYSSYPYHPCHYYLGQYKFDNSSRENLLLSLHENYQFAKTKSSKNDSNEIEENAINLPFTSKLNGKQEEDDESDKAIINNKGSRNPFPIISEPPTPNRTSSITSKQNQFLDSKYRYYPLANSQGTTRKILRQYNNQDKKESEEEDEIVSTSSEEEEEEGYRGKPAFRLSSEGRHATSDLDDYDDEDALDRFIPGNMSHTSGKLRFRQGSQAEVDINENENSDRSRRRPRRSVVHLYDMVVCSTGCNPLIFKGYGCYCGFLGSGLTVDGIDKCCAKHDWCYHHAKCPPLLTYFVPYYWRCDHGRPQCVTDFRGWKGICGTHLCECDRQFAECLKKFPCPRSRAMCVTSPMRYLQNLLMTPSMRMRYSRYY